MTLFEYRRVYGISYARIGKWCGVSPASISQIAAGIQKPTFDLALKIEHATDGRVLRDNWYPPRPADITITIGGISV
jgi:DNA-binding transcriptional regulator YdaS (Cro superfamily)